MSPRDPFALAHQVEAFQQVLESIRRESYLATLADLYNEATAEAILKAFPVPVTGTPNGIAFRERTRAAIGTGPKQSAEQKAIASAARHDGNTCGICGEAFAEDDLRTMTSGRRPVVVHLRCDIFVPPEWVAGTDVTTICFGCGRHLDHRRTGRSVDASNPGSFPQPWNRWKVCSERCGRNTRRRQQADEKARSEGKPRRLVCDNCGEWLPSGSRSTRRWCSDRCKQAHRRAAT